MSDARPDPVPGPPLVLAADDIVLVLVKGADQEAVEQVAVPAGATLVVADIVEVGPNGIGSAATRVGATVVVLPALIGRWIDAPASVPSLRLAVLVGPTLDERSAEGVRAVVAPGAEVVAWLPDDREPAPWEDGAPGVVAGGPAASTRADRPDLGVAVPGRDELERTVLTVFETVTGVAPVGRTDDLSALDVDRGRASWFADEVGWRLGVPLRAGELLDHPTVDAVIDLIRAGQGGARRRPVTAVLPSAAPSEGAPGPTLFLVHDLDGSPYSLLPIAADLPLVVIGFESPLLDGRPSPFAQLELMALRYLADLRRLQPEGPYILAGRGFGGALAYEIARQLLEEGAEVAVLVVADCGPGARAPVATMSGSTIRASLVRSLPRSLTRAEHRVALPERTAHAIAEHRRLLRTYRWPKPSASVAVTLGWSSAVGSDDSSLGWDGLVGRASVDIERLGPGEPAGSSSAPDDGWTAVLRRAVLRSTPASERRSV